VALATGEEVEAAAELIFDAVHRSPQLDDVVAEGGVREWLDVFNFEVGNEVFDRGGTHVRSVPSSCGVSMLLTTHLRRC
jgi:hypothetical protein